MDSVGAENNRLADQKASRPEQCLKDMLFGRLVERREDIVQYEDIGSRVKSSCQRDALALAP